MLDKISSLKTRLERIEGVNKERLRIKTEKDNYLNELYNNRDKIREDIKTIRFLLKVSAEYYIQARKQNLEKLASSVSEFMTYVLDQPYKVKFDINRKGNYDYLDIQVNDLEPRLLSGGEQQTLSLALVVECNTSGVLVLDETINSLDPKSLKNTIEYLNKVAEDKQIFMIELDDNLPIPYKYIVKDGKITRGNKI